jgi:hypothetical protein
MCINFIIQTNYCSLFFIAVFVFNLITGIDVTKQIAHQGYDAASAAASASVEIVSSAVHLIVPTSPTGTTLPDLRTDVAASPVPAAMNARRSATSGPLHSAIPSKDVKRQAVDAHADASKSGSSQRYNSAAASARVDAVRSVERSSFTEISYSEHRAAATAIPTSTAASTRRSAAAVPLHSVRLNSDVKRRVAALRSDVQKLLDIRHVIFVALQSTHSLVSCCFMLFTSSLTVLQERQ